MAHKKKRRPASFYQDAPALYSQVHLASVKKKKKKKSHNCENYMAQSLRTHNHTSVGNTEQLRLATFSQPTFFYCRRSLPRQRGGKLLLTHLFSQSHTHKQTFVKPALTDRGDPAQAFFHFDTLYNFHLQEERLLSKQSVD